MSHSQRLKLDELYMQRALSLAACADGTTFPNPMVGAVVVQQDAIVGEGYHVKAGDAHAEVLAIQAAGERASGATLYVTLEPCNHHGRTGPCTEEIIAAGIRRVVVASTDPNPEVRGGGVAALQAAGIQVEVGLLSHDEAKLNAGWRKQLESSKPAARP